MRILKSFAVALAATFAAPAAEAATADVVLTIEEIGGAQTLFKAEGALDLTTLTGKLPFAGFGVALSSPSGGSFGVGVDGSRNTFQQGLGPLTPFGSGGSIFPDSATGLAFGLTSSGGGSIRIDVNYVSGEVFTSTALENENFAQLGIAPGASAFYTLNNGQTISLDVLAPTPIPLPAALPLALAGVGALLAAGRRRSRV